MAFRADLTVSFACEKLGSVLFPGYEYSGEVVPAEIGIATDIFRKQTDICYTLDREDLFEMLPKRKKNSHKGSYGKILMITGSKGMSGAAYLSAKSAYISGWRSGADLYRGDEPGDSAAAFAGSDCVHVYRI